MRTNGRQAPKNTSGSTATVASQTRGHCDAEVAAEQWPDVSIAWTSSSANRPFDAPPCARVGVSVSLCCVFVCVARLCPKNPGSSDHFFLLLGVCFPIVFKVTYVSLSPALAKHGIRLAVACARAKGKMVQAGVVVMRPPCGLWVGPG